VSTEIHPPLRFERNADWTLKDWLGTLNAERTREVLEKWFVRDGTSADERRAALAQIVDPRLQATAGFRQPEVLAGVPRGFEPRYRRERVTPWIDPPQTCSPLMLTPLMLINIKCQL